MQVVPHTSVFSTAVVDPEGAEVTAHQSALSPFQFWEDPLTPSVGQSLGAFEKYLDQQKFNDVFQ